MRWLLRIALALGALAALVLLGAGVVIWAFGSTQGTAWLLGQAQARSNGALSIDRVHGSLLRGVTLERVALRFGRDEIDIDRVSLVWLVPAAFAGTLAFDDVTAGRVEYRRAPGAAEPASAAPLDLDLPVAIDVRAVSAESIGVAIGGEALELGPTRAAVRLAGGVLRIASVATETMGITFAGDAELTFGGALGLAGTVDWTRAEPAPALAGRLVVDGELPTLDVRHELTMPAAVTAQGTVTLADPPSVALSLDWDELAWPGFETVTSSGGTLSLEGSFESYRFAGSADALVAGEPVRLELGGGGAALAFVLDELRASSARGTVTAAGNVELDTRTAALSIAAADFDPSWFVAAWPGRLAGSVQLRAALEPLTVAADAFDVRGLLRERPLVATGAAVYAAPGSVQLANVRVESGASAVDLHGAVGLEADAPLDLTLNADVAALDALLPDVSGSLTAELEIGGTRAAPRASGRLEGAALAAFGYEIARIRIAGEAGFGADDPVDVSLEADDLVRGGIGVAALRADADGTSSRHRLSIATGGDRWQAHAAATGGWANAAWRGTLESLAIGEDALGQWTLVEPAGLLLGRTGTVLETTCLTHRLGGQWCTDLSIRGADDDRLVVAAQNFDLATLQPLLPPQLTIQGVYQLSASFADLTRDPRGSLAVSGGPTELQAAFSERQTFNTVLEGLTVGATLGAGALEIAASVRARDSSGGVRLETRIDDLRAEDSPIAGRLDASWPDLTFLRLVTPDVGDIGGAVEADLAIAGTVSAPELQGAARWLDGRVAVPQWGVAIERIAAQATSRDGRGLEFRAQGFVDDAELLLTGSTALDPRAGWPTRLALRGESVRAVQLPDVEIYVSPNLEVTAELPVVHVTGNLHVPRARIELSQLPPAAIAPSPDAVVHGTEEPQELRTLLLTSDILVTLGDAVQYLGLNLDTTVSGELRLRRDENRNTNATGSLMLDGTYSAYGQTLELERGQLLFNGPLDNPAIDVRAVRTIEQVRAGVELAGTVQAPRTRVFSEPAMSEADALSYLLLGRPVTGTGGEETATLQTAALAMGLQQALPVVQRIGQSLGLDEFTVQTTDTDAGALMAGKYLSPRVFIRYSYGLFNRIGGLLLRFKVNERLSVETRSGDQKSMDLLYTVEKD